LNPPTVRSGSLSAACDDRHVHLTGRGSMGIHAAARPAAAAGAVLVILTSGCAHHTSRTPTSPSTGCLAAGDETTINAALAGPSGAAVLCRGATFDLHGPVVFGRDGEQLYTEGLPTGSERAALRVASPSLATALVLTGRSGVHVSHVVVDGNREALGRIAFEDGGTGLIEAGGDASGQWIEYVQAFEPRGWTCLHAAEGDRRTCTGMTIAHNDFGPSGQANGEWADGLSFACRASLVHDNTVTDATDAGIVVFGAPGSIVAGNTVRALTRPLLGGITMVDYIPYAGDFTGTVVDSNLIDGAGRRIRIGLAMGMQTWTCQPGAPRLSGGVVSHNVLQGEMGYGYAVDGVTNWTVTANIDVARHTGTPVSRCAGRLPSVPASFQIARDHSSGTFQGDFADAVLDSALFAFGDPALQPLGRPR
jgi:hypothetical protein